MKCTAPVLVGRPFASIGMGELLRVVFRGFKSVGAPIQVHDVYRQDPEMDADLRREFSPYLTDELSPSVNIFCINGNEISEAFRRLRPVVPTGSYNVIWPMWELSRYPDEWAREVVRFHEVWVASRFTEQSIASAVPLTVTRMPLGIAPRLSRPLGRRYFGIPETALIFLFMFDFLSFVERKNPFAVLKAFSRLIRHRPGQDILLVIKLNSSEMRPTDHRRFMDALVDGGDQIKVIDRVMTDDEIRNLIRACDCFVSLHRSEGFGFSLGEAMYFGKPVIATAYSGNMEFMGEDTACLVPYRLVPVPDGSYPHTEDQVWADPDIDAAVDAMARLIDDPPYREALGRAASRHVRKRFSYGAAGLSYAFRLVEIMATSRAVATPLALDRAGATAVWSPEQVRDEPAPSLETAAGQAPSQPGNRPDAGRWSSRRSGAPDAISPTLAAAALAQPGNSGDLTRAAGVGSSDPTIAGVVDRSGSLPQITVIDDNRIEIDGFTFELDWSASVLQKAPTLTTFPLMKSRDLIDSYVMAAGERPIRRMLELGIMKGGSCVFFNRLFRPDVHVAVDLNPDPIDVLERYGETVQQAGRTFRAYFGTDQADAHRLRSILREHFQGEQDGRLDIDLVIDDASHLYAPTKASFNALFPFVRPGGLYAIEDWGWAHWAGLWQESSHPWAALPAMSNLVMEILMLCTGWGELIARVNVAPGVVFVERGPAAVDTVSFDVSNAYRSRGRQFHLI
jgi:glycosyltransferase involved in cell wall biosynthesis